MSIYSHPYFKELYHYGVKGMKWGVRRSPEELARARQAIASSEERSIIYLRGHGSAPPKSKPNSIIDHIDHVGKIDKRSYYDEKGLLVNKIDRPLTDYERKENEDIL